MPDNEWDPDDYDEGHGFVAEYGKDVVRLLDPQPDERVLDLGCGTGDLTAEIADSGAGVVGIDAVEKRLRPTLFNAESETWTIDYRRLRFVAER